MEKADADDSVRVVIVTGSGEAFCAGMDLQGDASGPPKASGTDFLMN
jgi:enoyl-CoA hydratase/carnithine racemase